MGSIVGKITGTTKAGKAAAAGLREAADMAKYVPYDVTNSWYGDVDFGEDTVSYELSPELQAFRDYYYETALGFKPTEAQQTFFGNIEQTGQDIFQRGSQTDIDQATSDYYNKQLRLLQPERAAEDVRLSERLYGTGRSDLGVSLGTGGYLNPEQYAHSLAREQANLALLTDAEDRARALQQKDLSLGAGLFGLGQEMRLLPITQTGSLLDMASGVEQMGMTPLKLGVDIGSAAQSGREAQAQGYAAAAQAQLKSSLANSGMFTNLLGQAASIPNWSSMSLPSFGGGGFTSTPRSIGAGGVGGYGLGMFSAFGM